MSVLTAGELVTGTAAMPAGQVRFALYPHALLRGTGFGVQPLLDLLTPAVNGPGGVAAASLAALRAAFADPRLSEAVAASNPQFHELALAPGRALTSSDGVESLTKHGRRQIRTAHRYVRRMLGKTETNAFFGPTLAITWDPAEPMPLVIGEPGPEECFPGLSSWLVSEIAGRLWRELPAARRAWRRDPLWQAGGEAPGILHRGLDGRTLPLTSSSAAVWAALAEPSTAAALCAATGLPAPEVVAALGHLSPALRPHPQPPSTLVDGLGWLLGHPGAEAGGDAAALTGRLAVLLGQVRTASWPESATLRSRIREEIAAAGITPGQGAGRHYADRDVVNEDRSSPWSGRVRLGGPAVRSAHAALAGILPVMLTDALLRQADARDAVTRCTGGVPAGLAELAARTIEPVTTRTDQWRDALAALVPAAPGLEEVHLTSRTLGEVMSRLWPLTAIRPDDQVAALPGLDLMVTEGPPGSGHWVLSECHDDSSSALGGITSRAQPGAGARYREFCDTVGDWLDTSRLATVLGRRRSRHITPELPGLTIELSGTSAKPASGVPGEVAPAAEVRVAADGAAAEYRGRRYQLYPGDVSSPLFTALSLPCLVPVPFATGRAATPRIVLDGVVVQRRRWVLALPDGAGRAGGRPSEGDVVGWAADAGLPMRFFLKHPGEPKPLLEDLRDPLCRAELTRLAPAVVVCTEVLPDLDDTWWEPAGQPQPAELRAPVLLRWETA